MRKLAKLGLLVGFLLVFLFEIRADKMVVRPVATDSPPDRAVFPAPFDQVWILLTRIVADYPFELALKDKTAGQLRTQYAVFSRHPHFSQLAGGVKAYGIVPRTFLHKWQDGRMRLLVEVHRVSPDSTGVQVTLEIQGLSSMSFDDAAISGIWKDCQSNGKFEFELLNELASRLKRTSFDPSRNPPDEGSSPSAVHSPTGPHNPEKEKEDLTNLMLLSVPEGAEIYLNDKLIGTTPSRLSVPAGEYRVLFRKRGYKDCSRAVVVFRRSDLTINFELEPQPDGDP